MKVSYMVVGEGLSVITGFKAEGPPRQKIELLELQERAYLKQERYFRYSDRIFALLQMLSLQYLYSSKINKGMKR